MSCRIILVTGGVISGLGKGCAVSSVGYILKQCGFHMTAMKIDGYLNFDAGTMSPHEHGETFVLRDGSETDLDLGAYSRMMDITLTGKHSLTSGKLFAKVLEDERKGKYLGQTVQMIPHVTNAIADWISDVGWIPVEDDNQELPEIMMLELGGTVGDTETMLFLEALRQIKQEMGDKFCHIHVTKIPKSGQQQKTKPTQHSCKQLATYGLSPDFIFGRSENPLTLETRKKISAFCHVPLEHVITMHDVPSYHDIPHMLEIQNIHEYILEHFKLELKYSIDPLISMNREEYKQTVRIALPGKYSQVDDTYLSIHRAFQHVEWQLEVRVEVDVINVEQIRLNDLYAYDGILVPGGFGKRGIQEKIQVIKYVRENQIPFLGICLGFQLAVLEYANHVQKVCCTSQEWSEDMKSTQEKDEHEPWGIIHMSDINDKEHLGGSMRLGAHEIILEDWSRAQAIYKKKKIQEIHRHRYEVNQNIIKEDEDLVFSAKSPDGKRVEMIELTNHPFFVGCQFHPEFESRLTKPAPLFTALVKAAMKYQNSQP